MGALAAGPAKEGAKAAVESGAVFADLPRAPDFFASFGLDVDAISWYIYMSVLTDYT